MPLFINLTLPIWLIFQKHHQETKSIKVINRDISWQYNIVV